MIKFGTSGWRGVIGEDFTFENVRIASQGVANYLKKSRQQGTGVIVAYDTRFLSEKFASECAKILAFNGIKAFLCTRDVPTPCVAFETVRRCLLPVTLEALPVARCPRCLPRAGRSADSG